MSPDVRRLHRRIPARLECEVSGPGFSTVGFTTNVSGGGLALRALQLPEDVRSGAPVEVKLRLHGEPTAVALQATVAWHSQRRIDGAPVHEVGVQWVDGAPLQGLEAFLAQFRFGVLVSGWVPDAAFIDAVAPAATVHVVAEESQLWARLEAPDVGLVVCGGGARAVTEVLRRTEAVGMPVVVVSERVEPALQPLLTTHARLLALPSSVEPQALAALVVRLLDVTTQSRESERLTHGLEAELQQLRAESAAWRQREGAHGLLGSSAAMQQVHEAIERLACLDTTVLLLGETGTGKGVTARAIQKASQRANKPFVIQNCAALPESLLDSELFGHVRGAFTGALSDRAGLFEAAHGGTLFLDELTEMSPGMQSKLLTVLQDGELRRVGANDFVRVDVRVLCATNQPLEPLVEQGRFREDLYYRLAPFVVRLPALREHREDVALLAAYFLAQFQTRYGGPRRALAPAAMAALEQAPWPGNVRQLQHVVERLAITASSAGDITERAVREVLDAPAPKSRGAGGEAQRNAGESLDDALRRIETQWV
ncbi:MAG: sigma 54-interacting transcriptional regulator, partial [Archangium sp.]|nr:sigma 54-interacting transcriptional regulator [Archangium sp.]